MAALRLRIDDNESGGSDDDDGNFVPTERRDPVNPFVNLFGAKNIRKCRTHCGCINKTA